MKTIGVLLFALAALGASQQAGLSPQSNATVHKPCIDLEASPASEGDTAAFEGILGVLHVDLDILLYVSHDPKLKDYGGGHVLPVRGRQS